MNKPGERRPAPAKFGRTEEKSRPNVLERSSRFLNELTLSLVGLYMLAEVTGFFPPKVGNEENEPITVSEPAERVPVKTKKAKDPTVIKEVIGKAVREIPAIKDTDIFRVCQFKKEWFDKSETKKDMEVVWNYLDKNSSKWGEDEGQISRSLDEMLVLIAGVPKFAPFGTGWYVKGMVPKSIEELRKKISEGFASKGPTKEPKFKGKTDCGLVFEIGYGVIGQDTQKFQNIVNDFMVGTALMLDKNPDPIVQAAFGRALISALPEEVRGEIDVKIKEVLSE